ncbi:archaemetzincin [Paraliomyxa miuraensis]|uniref:archaemetzincin n=1 Tax=Paraliomyxa miuraensis TaxID=376150 RepID=UPI00225B41DA|nr:archaemetzincin [Paraliomyxa miuraensis]MCX4242449.1 archaemetzincin [Paraliomyxa miuraensis]
MPRARAWGLALGLVVGCAPARDEPAAPREPTASSDPKRTVAGAFVPPGPRQRRDAVGSLEGLRGPDRRVFEEGEGLFHPVPQAGPGDWLDEHAERFQTFDDYRTHRTIHPDANRRAIYLVEIGEFPPGSSPSVDALARYVSTYFALPVQRLPPLDLPTLAVDARSSEGRIQLHAKQILERLRERKPDDAFTLVAITMFDLYPDEDWNFAYGYADGATQVGVFGFARLPTDPAQQLQRSAKTLTHELGHAFGVSHCTHYHCVMNGHNHEEEGRRAPMHLCPVDLRKLHHSIGFDPVKRYRRLLEVDRALGFLDEARWLEERLRQIEG